MLLRGQNSGGVLIQPGKTMARGGRVRSTMHSRSRPAISRGRRTPMQNRSRPAIQHGGRALVRNSRSTMRRGGRVSNGALPHGNNPRMSRSQRRRNTNSIRNMRSR